jgi:hypothetical protein
MMLALEAHFAEIQKIPDKRPKVGGGAYWFIAPENRPWSQRSDCAVYPA